MIRIVRARLDDSQSIRRLEEKLFGKGVTSPYDAATFTEYGLTFAAKDGEKLVGAIIAIKTMDDDIRVVDWIVHPDYRRRGIGTKLYEKLFLYAPKTSVFTYVETDNQPSLLAHQKIGFKIKKKLNDPYGQGSKHPTYIMQKER